MRGSVWSQGRMEPAIFFRLNGKKGKIPFRVQRSSAMWRPMPRRSPAKKSATSPVTARFTEMAGTYRNRPAHAVIKKMPGTEWVRRLSDGPVAGYPVHAEIRDSTGAQICRGSWTTSHASVRKTNFFGRDIWISGRIAPVQVPAQKMMARSGFLKTKELQAMRAHIRASTI